MSTRDIVGLTLALLVGTAAGVLARSGIIAGLAAGIVATLWLHLLDRRSSR